jgi:DNA-binding response OmpR family regulator
MKILVVDDDPSLIEVVTIALELQWEGIQVLTAADGEQGLGVFLRESPDITLLDVKMPVMDGWEMLRRARAVSSAPVIMLTARGDELARIKGLELGADDYLTKPFSHLELFARIKAVLRRTTRTAPTHVPTTFADGDLSIDLTTRQIMVAGAPVRLTPTEYRLLDVLVRNAGRVLSADLLLHKIWGEDERVGPAYLKTYISRLRHKLGDQADHPHYILTERGTGYRFARLPAPAPTLLSA